MTTLIHPTAVVDGAAELGVGVQIGPLAVIGAEVKIGAGTRIDAAAHVQGPTTMGEDNHVYPGAMIGFDPQDYSFGGEVTRLEIGHRNCIRELVTLNRGTTKGGGVTRIGDDNFFLTGAHVGHDCRVGDRTLFVNNATLAGHVEVQDDATIGAFSSVHQFCRVGSHAYIGGYSVVTRDALPFVKTVGTKPACYGINKIGLERKGFSAQRIEVLDRAYRILVRARLATDPALERLREELGEQEDVRLLVKFVEDSQRGAIREVPRRGGRGG